jgi:ABC-type transport system involved in cytochrome bd biosynthesis fused ATPase/permease subunit
MSSNNQPEPTPQSHLRALLPYTTVALIIAALYVAWTFYSRYESNRKAQEALQASKEEARKRVVDQVYGTGEIRFTTFGADSGVLRRGETTQLCYGVVNAKTVKLDPPVEQAKPSYHHCVEVAPKTTTTYTITAEDGRGNTKSESITIQVK